MINTLPKFMDEIALQWNEINKLRKIYEPRLAVTVTTKSADFIANTVLSKGVENLLQYLHRLPPVNKDDPETTYKLHICFGQYKLPDVERQSIEPTEDTDDSIINITSKDGA